MLSARMEMEEENFSLAEKILAKTQLLAKENGMLRSAMDLSLLRIEALLASSRIADAIAAHKKLESQVQAFPLRLERWEKLKKEIVARA